jgi:hypothetical protein
MNELQKNDTESGAWNFSPGLGVVLGECPHVPAKQNASRARSTLTSPP